jgi:hypothetical protein
MKISTATGAVALSAAVLATGFSACGTGTTKAVAGPFTTSCTIVQKGVATVAFRNNGGRPQNFRSFVLVLNRSNGKTLAPLAVKFIKKQTIGSNGSGFSAATVYHENITYRATKCKVVKVRP